MIVRFAAEPRTDVDLEDRLKQVLGVRDRADLRSAAPGAGRRPVVLRALLKLRRRTQVRR